MALAAATVWEVRTTGSDSNSGGFVAGASGTDYSQQNAAQYSAADLASTNGNSASPQVTSATHSFVAADVGNILRVTAGTSWTAGFYQIVSVATGAATLDRACGSAASLSGGSYVVGGAFASPAVAASARANGNTIYIKAGASPYQITSTTNNVPGGVVHDAGGASGAIVTYLGYATTRGDNGQATLQASGIATTTLFYVGGYGHIENLIFDGNSLTSIKGFNSASYTHLYNCKAINCTNGGIDLASNEGSIINCEAYNCTFSGQGIIQLGGGIIYGCEVHDCSTGYGIAAGNSGTIVRCLSYRNQYGFGSGSVAIHCAECVAAFNISHGFSAGGSNWDDSFISCLSYGNGGYGFSAGTTQTNGELVNCAGGSNTSGDYDPTQWLRVFNYVSLSVNPFVSASSTPNSVANLALNSTAGGGAACRAAGFPGTTPSGNSVGYQDIGALQHQDSGGPTTTNIFIIDD